ncbi:glycosyltransferase [Fictibacillus nanhaiensis]|uniref:Glycosyltransferase n=1 Tax=Fictibacillus nanhaiensis TaxID=742169 RepID=A0ABS2ZMY2_9BACL|nr:glycosyltransferase [Fictibacillus nanhaiensis]
MEKIKLSICMMVKNEEENLKRCLESIQKTIELTNVELIILDTGSDDNTISIAKSYTESVYFEKWNNSFSDMRNKSISYAKGEWLFILDADEEICEEEAIINMITTNDIDNYNSVQVTLRNITTNNPNNYSQIPTMRFFRNSKKFKYTGTVHNQPYIEYPIYTNQEIIINHYGYNSQDRELMERKFLRTKSLLVNELKNDPNNIYYRFQLAQTYNMHFDYKNAYIEIKYAYSLLDSTELKKTNSYIYQVYVNACLSLGKYTEAIEVSEEGYSIVEDFIDLYYVAATTKMKMGIEAKVKSEVNQYLSLFNNIKNCSISANPSIELFRVTPDHKNDLLYKFSKLLLDNKQEICINYIDMITDQIMKKSLLIKYFMTFNKVNLLIEQLNSVQNDENDDYLLEVEQEILKMSILERQNIYYLLSKSKTFYGLFNSFRTKDKNEKNQYLKEIENNIEKIIKTPFYWEIFDYITDTDMNKLFNLLKKAESLEIKEITRFLLNSSQKSNKLIVNYLEEKKLRENDLQGNRVYYCMTAAILLEVNKLVDVSKYNDLFNRYIDAGKNYVHLIFNPNLLGLTYKTLDDSELKLFMIFSRIRQFEFSNNTLPVIKLYKEAVQICPFYSKFIKNVIEEFERQILVS